MNGYLFDQPLKRCPFCGWFPVKSGEYVWDNGRSRMPRVHHPLHYQESSTLSCPLSGLDFMFTTWQGRDGDNYPATDHSSPDEPPVLGYGEEEKE